jgi:hypothetical protein
VVVARLLEADAHEQRLPLRLRSGHRRPEHLEPGLVEREDERLDDQPTPEVAHERCRRVLADVDRNGQQSIGILAT